MRGRRSLPLMLERCRDGYRRSLGEHSEENGFIVGATCSASERLSPLVHSKAF